MRKVNENSWRPCNCNLHCITLLAATVGLGVALYSALAGAQQATVFPPQNCTTHIGINAAVGWDGRSSTSCMPVISDSSGNVAIGTTSVSNYIGWPGSLNVAGQARAARYYDDDSTYYADFNSGANVAGTWNFNGASVFNGPMILTYEEYNDGEWYVCHHGQHLVLGHYCSASDKRLKTNIRAMRGELGKLARLRAVRFEWIDKTKGKGTQIGVLAQDFERDYPELVSIDTDGMKSFDYQRFTAVLLEGVKELKATQDRLQSEFERYKATHP